MWSAEIESDPPLIRIQFAGHVRLEDAQACAARIERLLADVPPNFTLLTDLGELEHMDIACRPVIDQIMEKLNKRGVRKVIRVVSDPQKDIGFGIMSLFHYGRQVHVISCQNLEEAKAHLPTG